MTGRPRYRAMVQTLEQLGGVDWIEERIANGDTLLTLSEEITRRAQTPISRFMLAKWIKENGHKERIDGVRQQFAADSLIERTQALVEETEADRESIALAKLKAETWTRIAGFHDRQRYGQDRAGVNVQVNLAALHLDAFRAAPVVPALPIPEAEVEVVDADS